MERNRQAPEAERAAGPRSALLRHGVPALLVLVHVALLVHGALHDTATFDEPAFVGGGVASYQGGHHVYPMGGALPQRLAGLLPVVAGVRLPADSRAWELGDLWELGDVAIFRSGHDPVTLLLLARLPFIACGAALAWTVHRLATRLFGWESGVIALVVHAFSPAFLAHGRIAAADVLAAAAFLWATWAAHRCLQRLTPASLARSCVATGALFVAKMSAVLLPPMILVLACVRLLARAPIAVELGRRRIVEPGARWLAVVAGLAAVHAVVAVLVIWTAHDFRHAASRDGAPVGATEGGWAALQGTGATASLVEAANESGLLPEAWLFGLQSVIKNASSRPAYAEGRFSETGWWWFFPWVVLLKTPPASLGLLILGLVALAASWHRGVPLAAPSEAEEPRARWARGPAGRDVLELLPLLSLVLVYGIVAVASNLNIGLRHVLPMLPAAAIVAGAAPHCGRFARGGRAAAAACAVLALATGLAAHPNELAWMNALGGPPERRWTHVVDSSLDWGQGLREAAAAVREEARPGETAYLSLFGTVDPASEGLRVQGLASFGERWRPVEGLRPGGGLFVVSATQLVQVFGRACRGPWTESCEARWQEISREMDAWHAAGPGERLGMLHGPDSDAWKARLVEHDRLLAARLMATLRVLQPLRAVDGGSILIWRLSDDEARAALDGPPPPPWPDR